MTERPPVPTGDAKLAGHCLCGAVSIELAGVKPGIEVCHCDMCRRWTGGPLFSLHGVSDEAVTLAGKENIALHASSDWAERAFCARCGSGLWYGFLPGGTRSFVAGLFDLPESWKVEEQIFVEERPHWAHLAAETSEKTGSQIIAEAKAAGYDFG